MKHIKSVIFDFAGTLCSEPYFKPLGQDSVDEIGKLVFEDKSSAWADSWMSGKITYHKIAEYLSEYLPHSYDGIISALREGCSKMSFNAAVHDFAMSLRQSGRKTALVTINTDIFSEVVVPAHNLGNTFDIVVNSSVIRTTDKCKLWDYAFKELAAGCSYGSSLLIDDSTKWCEVFEENGGFAQQYVNDQDFRNWMRMGWDTHANTRTRSLGGVA